MKKFIVSFPIDVMASYGWERRDKVSVICEAESHEEVVKRFSDAFELAIRVFDKGKA